MFSAGEIVVYGTQGVCRVKEIGIMKFGGTSGEYYILSPMADPRSVVYVPTDKPALTAKLRPVLQLVEIDRLIADTAREKLDWIANDNERKDYCDKVIKGGDRVEILRLMEMLYLHREALKDQKKHFHNVDAQYLKTAERMIHNEIAYVVGIEPGEVPEFIRSRMTAML